MFQLWEEGVIEKYYLRRPQKCLAKYGDKETFGHARYTEKNIGVKGEAQRGPVKKLLSRHHHYGHPVLRSSLLNGSSTSSIKLPLLVHNAHNRTFQP